MTLEEAIQQQITLGKKDPLEIARAIEEHSEQDWLASELLAISESLISEIARQRLGSIRRAAPLAVLATAPKKEWKLAPIWIPGEGWMRFSDLTVDHLQARARYYMTISGAAARWASWCLECVEEMGRQGVGKLGQLKGSLPVPPELEDVA